MALSLALMLSTLHILSDSISRFMKKHHYKVLSLSAGTLIAYIFLVMLPEVLSFSASPEIFIIILFGFTVFHMVEKYLYQHVQDKREKLKDLRELHIAGFFIDHFILGFVLVTTLEFSFANGFIFIIPIILHTISSSIAMEHIHESVGNKASKILLPSAPFIGAIFAIILRIDESVQALILAFVIGMLLYILSRDILPKKEKGYPAMFAVGVVIVIIIWSITEYVII
jgi:zinc transporter ZupT